jgi:hypothetical protein
MIIGLIIDRTKSSRWKIVIGADTQYVEKNIKSAERAE